MADDLEYNSGSRQAFDSAFGALEEQNAVCPAGLSAVLVSCEVAAARDLASPSCDSL